MKKYSVKPPKDLRSKFEAKVENKKLAEEESKEKKRKEEEDNRIAVSGDNSSFIFRITIQKEKNVKNKK